MGWVIITVVAFLTGVVASLGLGGGFILLIYLTAIANVDQLTAQGINLVFFLPIAVMSIILHSKNKLVEWKVVPMCAIFGAVGAVAGTLLAGIWGSEILSKLFAGLLIIVGIRELFHKPKDKDENKTENKNDKGLSK